MSNELNSKSKNVLQIIDEAFIGGEISSEDHYGHAVLSLAHSVKGSDWYSTERQEEHLHKVALKHLEKFGSKVLPKLKIELQNVLTAEEKAMYDRDI